MPAKLLTEFIGTFFLVLTIGLTVLIGTELAPLAIGVVLAAMVYMGGHISGAHYNPAVTVSVWMQGKMTGRMAFAYLAAQVLAAVGAAFAVAQVIGRPLLVQPRYDHQAEFTPIVQHAQEQFEAYQRPSPFVLGNRTLFSVMSDWNPAEIIGTSPNRLALSLYQYIITDDVCARQRAEFG
jgi:hypothetical protein